MGEITNSSQNAGAAPQQAAKTKRDLALERLKMRHPEAEYADDEAIYGAINDDYDADQKAIEGYKTNEKAMIDMMTADPRSAVFLQAMKNGKNPFVELVRIFGEEFVEMLTDPEQADAIAEAQAEYLKRVAESKKLDDEYEENIKKSYAVFDEMEKEFGEDVTNDLIGKIFVVANDVIRGKFTREALDMLRLAASHDEDVANAAHEGEVRGKNIKHQRNLELRRRGDGVADLASATAETSRDGDNQPDFGALGRMVRGGSIWDRGGEKRTRNR